MKRIIWILAAVLLLSACTLGAQPPADGGEPAGGQAASPPAAAGTETPAGEGGLPAGVFIEQVEVVIMESFPVQVAAIVRGSLPDACTAITGVDATRQDNLFEITLKAEQPAGAACAEVLTPFEERVPLDVEGLPAGTYMVDVNGVQRAFTLALDNTAPGGDAPTAAPAFTPTPQPSPTAVPTPTLTPTATPAEAGCTNLITFLGETVPDGTSFAAGTSFEKTWTLKNAGSCTWTTEYAAVFVEGDRMGAAASVPLPKEVAPGQKVTVRVPFVAPDSPGAYRSVWRLQTPQGVQFGPGKRGQGQFWVDIQVTESTAGLNLGAPTWTDAMNSAANWFLVDTADTRFRMKDGALEMTAITPGALDAWGLSQRPAVDDFYLEVDFRTGETCSGLDRYGVIVRAPSPSKGYVFGFSCDGRFRLYLWDGATYTGLQEWRVSPVIRTGPGKSNTLGIWVKGAQFKLYANGQLLASVQEDTFGEGQFGLFIASDETPKFKVRVEEVRFWDLTP